MHVINIRNSKDTSTYLLHVICFSIYMFIIDIFLLLKIYISNLFLYFYLHLLYIYIFLFYREIICCGSIFRGANGEIVMYPSSLKPCVNLARRQLSSLTVASPIHSSASTSPVHSVESPSSSPETSSKQTKTDSDSSSDSGYDESLRAK